MFNFQCLNIISMLYFINNNQIGLLRIREYQEHKSCPYKYLYSSFHIAYGMRCSAAAVIHMHERTTRICGKSFFSTLLSMIRQVASPIHKHMERFNDCVLMIEKKTKINGIYDLRPKIYNFAC